MSKVDFELNLKGLNQLMKSSEMVKIQEEYANKVKSSAESISNAEDPSYRVRTVQGNYINFTHIEPDSESAERDNYENNTLLKALDGSGLPKEPK